MKKTLLLNVFLTILLFTGLQTYAQSGWKKQTSGVTDTLYAVQFLDAGHGFVCGDSGTVLKTTDSGSTWSPVSINTSNPVQDMFFVNDSTGWAVVGNVNNSNNSGQIWKTTDAGANWTKQTYSSTRARLGVSFADTSTGWACGSRNGPIDISNTTNGGTKWNDQSNSSLYGWMYKIDALSTMEAYAVGVTFFPSATGMILHTTNGGSTWSQESTGTIPLTYDVEAVDTNTIFVTGNSGLVMATTNGGSKWTTQTTGTTDNLWRISFANAMTGMACGDKGTIIGTTDGGSTWNNEKSGVTARLNGIFVLDSMNAWAVGDAGIILAKSKSNPTGLNTAHAQPLQVKVFPNPFTNQTNIIIENSEALQNLTFHLYDINGREIRQREVNTGNLTLKKGSLKKGVYYYWITGKDVAPKAGKILIQ